MHIVQIVQPRHMIKPVKDVHVEDLNSVVPFPAKHCYCSFDGRPLPLLVLLNRSKGLVN